ncbi:MAG: DUF1127 domain-containing protein [Thiothrix sp.]|nr:MAG: DUF1127 domain-containing protein [Thiothrix sp.]
MKLYSILASIPLGNWEGTSFEQLIERFKQWQTVQALKHQVAKERSELADLPDYILKDIGLSAGDVYLESQRSIDDLPEYRVQRALRHAKGCRY